MPRFTEWLHLAHSGSSSSADAVETNSTPPSENPDGRSNPAHTTKRGTQAAVNALVSILEVLGSTPIPGIESVADILIQVIERVQDLAEAESGWKGLAERMTRLSYLATQFEASKTERLEETLQDVFVRDVFGKLCGALRELAKAIESANDQGRIVRFLNAQDDIQSIASHETNLDRIILDLIAAVCLRSELDRAQINRELQDAVNRLNDKLADLSQADRPVTQLQLTANEIDYIMGSVLARNRISGPVKAVMTGNRIHVIQGPLLTDNIFT